MLHFGTSCKREPYPVFHQIRPALVEAFEFVLVEVVGTRAAGADDVQQARVWFYEAYCPLRSNIQKSCTRVSRVLVAGCLVRGA